MKKQLNVGGKKQQKKKQNSPRPEIHRSRRTQGIMTGEWRGQNLRKTVGECEIEVGRHKHMHEMKQCSSVLLRGRVVGGRGDGCYSPSVLSPLYQWKAGSLSSVRLSLSLSLCLSLSLLLCWLVFFFPVSPLPLCVSLFGVAGGQLLFASHALSCWCELVDFLCLPPLTLSTDTHTHTPSLSLSRSHGFSSPIHSESLQPSLAPLLLFLLSLSLSLSVALPLTALADTVGG